MKIEEDLETWFKMNAPLMPEAKRQLARNAIDSMMLSVHSSADHDKLVLERIRLFNIVIDIAKEWRTADDATDSNEKRRAVFAMLADYAEIIAEGKYPIVSAYRNFALLFDEAYGGLVTWFASRRFNEIARLQEAQLKTLKRFGEIYMRDVKAQRVLRGLISDRCTATRGN
jgi:hypothetical protein